VRLSIQALTIMIACVVPALAADMICPGDPGTAGGAVPEELRIREDQLDFATAMDSVTYLEKQVPSLLDKHTQTKKVIQDESYYIGYPNSLRIIRGSLLRQRALIARERMELTALKSQSGKAGAKEREAAEREYRKAAKDLCSFLKGSGYAD